MSLPKPIPPANTVDSVRRIRRIKFGYRVSVTVRTLRPDDLDEERATIVAFCHLADTLRDAGYDLVRLVREGPRGTLYE